MRRRGERSGKLLSLCSSSFKSQINHTCLFTRCPSPALSPPLTDLLRSAALVWFWDSRRWEDEEARDGHLRASALKLLCVTAINPHAEPLYIAISFFCGNFSHIRQCLAIAMTDIFAFGNELQEHKDELNLPRCLLWNVILGWRKPAPIHPHCSPNLVNRGLLNFKKIFVAHNASWWLVMLGPLLTRTTTQHWSVRFKMFHLAAPTADISELWSVKIKSVCAALKARPPVQTHFPSSCLMWFVKNQSAGLFYGPFTSYQKPPVCLRLKRPGCNKRLRLQQQSLWQGDLEKTGPEPVTQTHASGFCDKHTHRCSHARTVFTIPHSTPCRIGVFSPFIWKQFLSLSLSPGLQPNFIITNFCF